ncbi:MAG: C40 family peptidase [Acidobacteriota bacterium]|jgi:hypothetical protein
MKKVSVSIVSLLFLCIGWASVSVTAAAQENPNFIKRTVNRYSPLPSFNEAVVEKSNFLSLVLPVLRTDVVTPPQFFINEASSILYREITKRLGIRYRFYGTDDRGYDCSGFVWRVFQSAGSDFERVAARSLWAQLPEATDEEKAQFGTLVFFNGLKHVGIVRDSKTFYHASRTQGVTLSTFDGYWGERITGYRRAPARLALDQ